MKLINLVMLEFKKGSLVNVFCSYCHKPIGYKEDISGKSHGICYECMPKVVEQYKDWGLGDPFTEEDYKQAYEREQKLQKALETGALKLESIDVPNYMYNKWSILLKQLKERYNVLDE